MCVGGSRGGDQAAAEPQEDTGQAGQEGEQGGGEAPAGHDGDRGGGPEPGGARSVGDLCNLEMKMSLLIRAIMRKPQYSSSILNKPSWLVIFELNILDLCLFIEFPWLWNLCIS